jgi:hypothetical protein
MAGDLTFARIGDLAADRRRTPDGRSGGSQDAAPRAEAAAAEIGRALLALTGAPRAAVFFRAINGRVTCPWSHSLSDAYVKELITPDGVNPWAHLMRYPELQCMDMPKNGRSRVPAPYHLTNVRELPFRAAVRARLTKQGAVAVSTWPLVRGGRLIGAVACYYDAPYVCTAEDEAAMLDFAAQAAAAVPAVSPADGRDACSPKSGDGTIAVQGARAICPDTPAAASPAERMGGRPVPCQSYERLVALDRDLAAKQARLTAQRASLETESHRMAAEAARLAAERRMLQAEHARLGAPTSEPAESYVGGPARDRT